MKLATSVLVFCVGSLLALGLVMLYSAIMADKSAHYLSMQTIWCVLGLVSCLVMASVDYHLLKRVAWPLFILAVILLALVLVPQITPRINGARRWFKEPHTGVRFEPSELAKIALILALAAYADHHQRQMGTFRKGIVIPGLFIGVVLGLIFIEPDCGTMMLLASVSGAMLLVAGVRWRFILPPAGVAAAGLGYFLWRDPMRSKRIFCLARCGDP